MNEKRLCFVIMPFAEFSGWNGGRWTQFFEREIRPVLEQRGYRCERSTANRGNILRGILQNLASAHVVLADVTGLNVNVLYELGLRHALSPRTLMITRDDPGDLPFDLKHYGCRQYSVDDPEARDAFTALLQELLDDVDENPDREDSPVADFVDIRERAYDDRATDREQRYLRALDLELTVCARSLGFSAKGPGSAARLGSLASANAVVGAWEVDNEKFILKLSKMLELVAWYDAVDDDDPQMNGLAPV